MVKYRYDIGMSKYPYGMELEFMTAVLQNIYEHFKKKSIPSELIIRHKTPDIIFDKNIIDLDNTVSHIIDGVIYGGEISSRLYQNQDYDWKEIEIICDILREEKAEICSNCSNHISIKVAKVKDRFRFFEVLSKVVADYEQELETYYRGDYYLERDTKQSHAYSIGPCLRNIICYFDLKENKEKEINDIYLPTFSKKAGINLSDYPQKQRIEIRYPNGTIDKKTIQNNINFSLKLIDALLLDKFDIEKMTTEIIKREQSSYYENLTDAEHLKRFKNIVETISTSTEDEDDFMSQYEKVLSFKQKVR